MSLSENSTFDTAREVLLSHGNHSPNENSPGDISLFYGVFPWETFSVLSTSVLLCVVSCWGECEKVQLVSKAFGFVFCLSRVCTLMRALMLLSFCVLCLLSGLSGLCVILPLQSKSARVASTVHSLTVNPPGYFDARCTGQKAFLCSTIHIPLTSPVAHYGRWSNSTKSKRTMFCYTSSAGFNLDLFWLTHSV